MNNAQRAFAKFVHISDNEEFSIRIIYRGQYVKLWDMSHPDSEKFITLITDQGNEICVPESDFDNVCTRIAFAEFTQESAF
jgi:hypothetical protein